MTHAGSVAPRERVNIVYQADTGGATVEKELPLKLLVMGDFSSRRDDTPLEDRTPVDVTRDNLDEVLAGCSVTMAFTVPDRLDGRSGGELPVRLAVTSMQDFAPASIARQMPELRRLLELREALASLKGILGNIPAFSRAIQELVQNDQTRVAILAEIRRNPDPSPDSRTMP